MPYTSTRINCSMQVIAADINYICQVFLLNTSMTYLGSFQFRIAHIPTQKNRRSRLSLNIFSQGFPWYAREGG